MPANERDRPAMDQCRCANPNRFRQKAATETLVVAVLAWLKQVLNGSDRLLDIVLSLPAWVATSTLASLFKGL
jgi:hypothetical protein